MKNFKQFKDMVEGNFLVYMGDDYKDCRSDKRVTRKVNVNLHSITLVNDSADIWMSPVLYIEEMYDKYINLQEQGYKEEEAYQKTMESYVRIMRTELEQVKENCKCREYAKYLADSEVFKEKLILQVVGKELNEELLKGVPHRIVYNDLAVVYRINVGDDDGFTILINDSILKNYGIDLSEDELYEIALKNTQVLVKVTAKSLFEAAKELGYDGEESDIDNDMYVVASSPNCHSATLILNPANFESIAEKLNSDLFIIPSSNMEYICKPYNEEEVEVLKNIIREVNGTLRPEEVLSYGLYRYKDGSIDAVAV